MRQLALACCEHLYMYVKRVLILPRKFGVIVGSVVLFVFTAVMQVPEFYRTEIGIFGKVLFIVFQQIR